MNVYFKNVFILVYDSIMNHIICNRLTIIEHTTLKYRPMTNQWNGMSKLFSRIEPQLI